MKQGKSTADASANGFPAGGLQLRGTLRRWRWSGNGEAFCAPIRCKREEWYLLKATTHAGSTGNESALLRFENDDGSTLERCVRLSRVPTRQEQLGWVQAPPRAVRVRLAWPGGESGVSGLTLHPTSERDPKCHPGANVPRWSTYRPPFPLERIVLPASLECLRGELDPKTVEVIAAPRSLRKWAGSAIGSACVLDPAWARTWGLTLAELEKLAPATWMIVDLATMARLVRQAGMADVDVVERRTRSGIMSARVEYTDVATRGMALLDTFPYGTVDARGVFVVKALRTSRSWRRYAGEAGFATLLSSQTPREDQCNDVLSATRAVGQGELLTTDLPWLAAGQFGPLVAPRLTRHLLRMHLGLPLEDDVQFWNRWDDETTVVRDIADLARRYVPLRAARWAPPGRGLATLGLTLPVFRAPGVAAGQTRRLVIHTGRIDNTDMHDGLPPEPFMIFMKQLARHWRERTAWASANAANVAVTWQFETGRGARYAPLFEAADAEGESESVLHLPLRASPAGAVAAIDADIGLMGEGALEFQGRLTRMLMQKIESVSR